LCGQQATKRVIGRHPLNCRADQFLPRAAQRIRQQHPYFCAIILLNQI
jgi:hypothetical protein